MLRTDKKIAGFLAFEVAALAALTIISTSAVDEFRGFDPLGYWPAFVMVRAAALSALLTTGNLICGWGMRRLVILVAAKRLARRFQYA